ncbi:hypothetical protein AWB92_03405 [Mycobacterium sp. IEC1808]|uniref:hypothetical protein n=1 Tax=Mycobacterium sp. IEC1808 TaxID=1743230 RepID=UPI000A1656D2|nr:hypothetical protein [Mycobacterium sp. IEC1808]ORW97710.1 hypothetical protein AWB92_03405 [Mycobacterium sp. IEC1808]
MTNRVRRTAAAICAGAGVVLAVGLGVTGAGESPGGATAQSSIVVPAPGDGGGAIPVQPVGGGACVIGLNCGCIPHRTCPTPHPHPGTAGANQHDTPPPQNP